jgi:hypothetical protein
MMEEAARTGEVGGTAALLNDEVVLAQEVRFFRVFGVRYVK